jgi:hypothetical protein
MFARDVVEVGGLLIPEIIKEQEYKRQSHQRYVHSDGGNILSLYVRLYTFRNSRLFQSINMFQCDKCYQFFAMEDGTRNLIPLVVKRKNGGDKK